MLPIFHTPPRSPSFLECLKIACLPLVHLLHFFARLCFSLPKISPKLPEKRTSSIYLNLKIKALDPSHSFRMTVMRILNGI